MDKDCDNIIKLYLESNEQQPRVNEQGDKYWYKDASDWRLHRLNGPALEWADGRKEWYVDGHHYRTITSWAKAALYYEQDDDDYVVSKKDVEAKITQVMQQDLFN